MSFAFFNWLPRESHTGIHGNSYSNIFMDSSIVTRINFSDMPLKERGYSTKN